MKAETFREALNDLQVEIKALREKLATAQPDFDLSEYSDKLWKAAYERGKAKAKEEIIQCKDCNHCTFNAGAKIYCDELDMRMYQWDYCSRAERRTDGAD